MTRPLLSKTLAGLALGSVLATGCEPPPVVATADHRQQVQMSRIDGEVVVTQTKARGNAIILLYDARYPPPPQGAGRPLTFTVIPREQLFGAADPAAGGPFTAPFTFSQVAAGKYLVRGFIDVDRCSLGPAPCLGPDFIPWYTVTGEPNAGDIGGAAVDALTGAPRVVEIAENPDKGPLQAATGITVSFSGTSSTIPLDRPAFWVEGGEGGIVRLDRTMGVRLTLRPLELQRAPMDLRAKTFFGRYFDSNGDGVPEAWPRVVVRKLADGPPEAVQRFADDNDLDRNGIPDVPEAPVVVLGADLDASVYDTLRGATTPLVPLMSLGIVVYPRAYDARTPSAPVPLPQLPAGRYALTLVHFTGQTWRVPNDLSQAVTLTETAPEKSQSLIIEVP